MISKASTFVIRHTEMDAQALRKKIRAKEIAWAGNLKLNIYGTLHCKSGKRLKIENRVFFHSAQEAIQQGFRPCGHCLIEAYKHWKDGII